MNCNLIKINSKCVSVTVDKYPNILTWKFENGVEVQTTNLDLTIRADMHAIAALAERFGLGKRADIVRYLPFVSRIARIPQPIGEILPLPAHPSEMFAGSEL